jgi:hypothetical protein
LSENAIPATRETFDAIYQKWLLTEKADLNLEANLLATYRLAWKLGELNDRLSVLTFVFFARESNGYDLVIEGLGDDDELVASHTAAVCSGLLLHRCDLGPNIRAALEAFSSRFPKWALIATYSLDVLKAQGR